MRKRTEFNSFVQSFDFFSNRWRNEQEKLFDLFSSITEDEIEIVWWLPRQSPTFLVWRFWDVGRWHEENMWSLLLEISEESNKQIKAELGQLRYVEHWSIRRDNRWLSLELASTIFFSFLSELIVSSKHSNDETIIKQTFCSIWKESCKSLVRDSVDHLCSNETTCRATIVAFLLRLDFSSCRWPRTNFFS